MGRHNALKKVVERFLEIEFPMIPPQVNGATPEEPILEWSDEIEFPMIPPQVNGATISAI